MLFLKEKDNLIAKKFDLCNYLLLFSINKDDENLENPNTNSYFKSKPIYSILVVVWASSFLILFDEVKKLHLVFFLPLIKFRN